MKRFDFTVTKPVLYHCSIDAETRDGAKKKLKKHINDHRLVSISYAQGEGEAEFKLNSELELTPKKYNCRVFRELYKDIVVEAESPDQALDIAMELVADMEDSEFDLDNNDASVGDVIYAEDTE